MLRDLVDAMHPEWCVVKGEFTPRGGLSTSVLARWPGARPPARLGLSDPAIRAEPDGLVTKQIA